MKLLVSSIGLLLPVLLVGKPIEEFNVEKRGNAMLYQNMTPTVENAGDLVKSIEAHNCIGKFLSKLIHENSSGQKLLDQGQPKPQPDKRHFAKKDQYSGYFGGIQHDNENLGKRHANTGFFGGSPYANMESTNREKRYHIPGSFSNKRSGYAGYFGSLGDRIENGGWGLDKKSGYAGYFESLNHRVKNGDWGLDKKSGYAGYFGSLGDRIENGGWGLDKRSKWTDFWNKFVADPVPMRKRYSPLAAFGLRKKSMTERSNMHNTVPDEDKRFENANDEYGDYNYFDNILNQLQTSHKDPQVGFTDF